MLASLANEPVGLGAVGGMLASLANEPVGLGAVGGMLASEAKLALDFAADSM